MSNSHLFMKSGFIRTPSQNGIGRYVNQLQRVVFKFCKNHGASRGMRDFIEKDLVNFATENPGTVVYLKPRRHRGPVISAEYLNGEKDWISCHNLPRDEILKWLELLRTQSGQFIGLRLRKLHHTDNPSVQGPWTPFTFRDPKLNLAEFPNENLSKTKPYSTAQEDLKKIFEKQQLYNLENRRAE